MMKRIYILVLTVACYPGYAQLNPNSLINAGNKLYEEKKYKEAAIDYQKAIQKNPTNVPGIFNLGNTLYQQGQLDASRQVLNAATKVTKNKNEKSGAHYNIGNTYMTEKKWEDAAEAYKQALRNNPNDGDAKYNLSYAEEMLKKQQSGGGKNNKQNQDKNKQDKQKQQNKDQKKQDQNKDQQNQNKNQDKKEDKQQQQPESQPSKLSKQQADQLLNALQQEEKKLQDKKQKEKGVPVKMEKDW